MQLIAVIMKAPDRDIRNEAAKKLLDFGFASYSKASFDSEVITDQYVKGGERDTIDFYIPSYTDVLPKGSADLLERSVVLNDHIKAPLHKNDTVGTVTYKLNGEVVYEDNIIAYCDVNKITYFGLISRLFKSFIMV